jgi:hypothetical protein
MCIWAKERVIVFLSIHREKPFMRVLPCLFIALCVSTAASGQSLTIGVKGGARLTDDLDASPETVSESRRYMVGLAIEIGLWRGLGIECDALYRRLGKSTYSSYLVSYSWSRDRSDSFEFPILAKWRWVSKAPRPCVSGGYAFRHISGSGSADWINTYPTSQSGSYTYSPFYEDSYGLVFGSGLEFDLWRMKVSPEFRYTSWFTGGLADEGSRGYHAYSAKNQAEILVGIGWLARPR